MDRFRRYTWLWCLVLVAISVLTPIGLIGCLGLMDVGKVLYQWQSRVSGVLAIVAALIGGTFVLSQVRQADLQEQERLRRRHEAARAVMPLTLSALMEYARGCGRALRILYLSTRSTAVSGEAFRNFELPTVPSAAVPELARMIEATTPDVAEAIAKVLRDLQVQDVRLRSLRADALDPHAYRRSVAKLELDDYIIDAADLYARCEALLDFARKQTAASIPEPGAAAVLRALFLMSFHSSAFDRVKAKVQRRYGEVLDAAPDALPAG